MSAYGQAVGNALFFFGGVLDFVSSVQGLDPAVQRQLVSTYFVDYFLAASVFLNFTGG